MNNRPLTYNDGVIEYPVLKPNSMILGREATVLEENQMMMKVTGGNGNVISRGAKIRLGGDGKGII